MDFFCERVFFVMGLVLRQEYIPHTVETVFLVTLKHVAQETGCLFDFGMDTMSFHCEVSHLLFPMLESFLSMSTMLSFK